MQCEPPLIKAAFEKPCQKLMSAQIHSRGSEHFANFVANYAPEC